MAETETLTITLPADLVRSIRERVAAGEFASESDVIVHDLVKRMSFLDGELRLRKPDLQETSV